jgi:nitrogen regulatory protein P-II 1
MKMVWAVIRSSKVDPVARALKDIGVGGCTVFPVRGYGDEWHLYEPLIHGGHHRLEAVVADDQVDRAVNAILEHSFTGLEGDGILSVLDLGTVVQIRLKNVFAETKVSSIKAEEAR